MATPQHLLVIRLSAMGDVAMAVPVLRVLKKQYPKLNITVVSRGFFQPLFSDIPDLQFLEADVYGKHRGLGILKLADTAKASGVDAVADLHNVIRSKILSNYLKLKGIPVATIDKGRAEKKAITQAKKKELKPLTTTHQRYAAVFEALGFPLDLKQHVFPERKRMSPQINALIGVEPKKLIGIAPFAAHSSKEYSLEQMEEVMAQLDATSKYNLFLFGGGKKETAILKELQQKFTSVTSVTGKFDFKEELALISNLDVMLAMDSGNGHLAAMYGVPVVTLWGVTHPYVGFTPFAQPAANQLIANRDLYPLIPTSVYGNKYPKGYEKAINTIPPELVVKRVLEIL